MNYKEVIDNIYNEVKPFFGKGHVADYIPALANIDPKQYGIAIRSEEHTSELQSHSDLVCRLLLEKNFFNDTATTEIYTLSLHDALPISM